MTVEKLTALLKVTVMRWGSRSRSSRWRVGRDHAQHVDGVDGLDGVDQAEAAGRVPCPGRGAVHRGRGGRGIRAGLDLGGVAVGTRCT